MEFRFFKNNYSIVGPDWNIEGSIMAHDYRITEENDVIADVSKKWLSWGDSYLIDIYDERQHELLLGAVIVIDCVISENRKKNSV